MSKKTMLLAAGVLSALALADLPAVASAQELEAHCPVAPCNGTISATNAEHAIEYEAETGGKIDVTAVDGTISIGAATTTTGITELTFTHVYETTSGFKFTCNSPGAAAGVIKTGAMTAHFVNLTTGANPGVLLTLPTGGITYACAGFTTRTLTGSIIGTITTPNCNLASATNVVTFNKKAGTPGTQEHELWTGKTYDLTSGTQASDGTTSALTARLNITWPA